MSEQLEEALEAIALLRKDGARVHSITNTVAQNFTANVLLACGAIPSMTVNPDEVEAFTTRADCLHINLGTLDAGRIVAIEKSLALAQRAGKPVLLDPVMANVSQLRAEFAEQHIAEINILRGNTHEIQALVLGEIPNLCLVETGAHDTIKFDETQYTISNGHPLMSKTIATGCAISALIAALASKAQSPAIASLAGLLWFGVAGELAAEKAQGPGSFAQQFLDCLHNVSIEALHARARVK